MPDNNTNKTMIFWLDGDYSATGGYFVRSELKDFINLLISKGEEPVGIKIDLESFDLEVIVKNKE